MIEITQKSDTVVITVELPRSTMVAARIQACQTAKDFSLEDATYKACLGLALYAILYDGESEYVPAHAE